MKAPISTRSGRPAPGADTSDHSRARQSDRPPADRSGERGTSAANRHAAGSLPEEVRSFLDAPRFATLATVDPDGTPHQAVTWYVLDGDAIVVNSRRGRRWPANIERDPNVHLAVYDLAEPTHWVGLKGRARFLRDGDVAVEDIVALARRYADDDPERFRGQDRVTFAIDVDRAFEYGAD